MSPTRITPLVAAAAMLLAGGTAVAAVQPARFSSGPLAATPPRVTTGGQVILDVHVDAEGAVGEVVALRRTPPYTEALREAVEQWSFEPAREDGSPVPDRVLVMGVFVQPRLQGEPGPGTPPRDVGQAPPEEPFPTRVETPAYPARAVGGGTVLLAVTVGADGAVDEAAVAAGEPPFSSVAAEAVRRWQFRPASRGGVPAPATAYVLVSFPEPVLAEPMQRP